MSRARSGERAERDVRCRRAHACLSADGSCSSQNRTSICCLELLEPSQKIELVFSASPETIRREPREHLAPSLSRQSAGPGSLRIDDPVLSLAGSLLRCPGLPLLCRGKDRK